MQTVKYCAAEELVLLFLTGCGPAPREAVGPCGRSVCLASGRKMQAVSVFRNTSSS